MSSSRAPGAGGGGWPGGRRRPRGSEMVGGTFSASSRAENWPSPRARLVWVGAPSSVPSRGGASAGGGEMVGMKVFDCLFEAYGDEEAEDDGCDVDEEVAPGAGGVVRGVDIEHGGWFLVRRGWGWFGGVRGWGWDGVGLGHEVDCD